MERINQIVNSAFFQESMRKTASYERTRSYCKHGMDHALTVARIAYIYLLERRSSLSKEIIYGAALLHDIGRFVEYETGQDHAEAGARLARPLLEEAGFDEGEIETMVQGIREHRQHGKEGLSPLGEALALADDWGRDCWACESQNDCYKFGPHMLKIEY